ncbi:glycosyltransferase [Caballeronia sp. LjRoot31]|uniref:glycosyltransferase n=1 Tax=Caballeronia sp. LjRoot31 TaxID=3342324 RepID=UPI003ECF2917
MLQVFVKNKNGKSQSIKLGDDARDARRWQDAVEHYNAALSENPNNDGIWVQLGHAQKELGQFAKAEESYLKALKLKPNEADTNLQIGHLFSVRSDSVNAARYYREAIRLGSYDKIAATYIANNVVVADELTLSATDARSTLYFDYSDLVQYFRHNRFPTGIQRVQIEMLKAAQESSFDVPIRACTFSEAKRFWVDLDPMLFRRVCDLSSLPGGEDDAVWRSAVNDLIARIEVKPAIRFPAGAALINVGTSWWIKDYGTYIRHAKQKYGLRYVPFVHDVIPLITPEHCSKGLVEDFRAWIHAVMLQADFMAVNSVNTQKDVVALGQQRNALSYEPQVVRLDAEFSRNPDRGDAFVEDVLLDFGLSKDDYVLFVGTLESRKNHAGVFSAWKKLIAKHSVDKVPTLVCVGKRGWLFEEAAARLEKDSALSSKVMMLSGISDDELASLYRGCLFTVYASHYEGWGLPVTESLSFGKVCLTADNSSLPEAGGKFADYFDNDSVTELVTGLDKLIFDDKYREQRESEIRKQFVPRDWAAVLGDLVNGVRRHFETHSPEAQRGIAAIRPSILYTTANAAGTPEAGEFQSIDPLRHELTWHPLEAWGSWARSKVAKVAFTLQGAELLQSPNVLIYIKLQSGPLGTATRIRLGNREIGKVRLNAGETRFVRFKIPRDLLELDSAQTTFNVLAFYHERLHDLSEQTQGADQREIGLGLCAFGLCAESDFGFRLELQERDFMIVL